MTHQSQLENRKYRNWVKAGLGLKYTKEGLEPFCDDLVKQQHADILNKVKQKRTLSSISCGQCDIKYLQPDHVRTRNRQCPLGQVSCNCQHPSGKNTCPNNVCSSVYDEIIQLHESRAPYWKNTDSRLWCSEPWAVGKCFINAGGYQTKLKASEFDCSALLHVLLNNLDFFQNAISGTGLVAKVLQHRNEIVHSHSMELDDNEVTVYIDDMTAVLEDRKALFNRNESRAAVHKLLKLKSEDFIITNFDESEVRKVSMKAINEKEKELEQKLTDVTDTLDTKANEIKSKIEQLGSDIKAKLALCMSEIKNDARQTGQEVKDDLLQTAVTLKNDLEFSAKKNMKAETVALKHEIEQTGKAVENNIIKVATERKYELEQKGRETELNLEPKMKYFDEKLQGWDTEHNNRTSQSEQLRPVQTPDEYMQWKAEIKNDARQTGQEVKDDLLQTAVTLKNDLEFSAKKNMKAETVALKHEIEQTGKAVENNIIKVATERKYELEQKGRETELNLEPKMKYFDEKLQGWDTEHNNRTSQSEQLRPVQTPDEYMQWKAGGVFTYGHTTASFERYVQKNWNGFPAGDFVHCKNVPVGNYLHNLHQLAKWSHSVCQIRFGGYTATGFRVGSKYVMTTLHVVKIIYRLYSDYQRGVQIKRSNVTALAHQNVFCLFDYFEENQFENVRKHFFRTTVHFFDEETDTAVLELVRNQGSLPLSPPFQEFGLPDIGGTFTFLGHEGGAMENCMVDLIIDKDGEHTREDIRYVKEYNIELTKELYECPPHNTLNNEHRLLFHCKLGKGAAGSPGISVLEDGRVVVVTMLLCGYPNWYYDQNADRNLLQRWPKEYCIEQGTNMISVGHKMYRQNPGLHEEIFRCYNIPAPST